MLTAEQMYEQTELIVKEKVMGAINRASQNGLTDVSVDISLLGPFVASVIEDLQGLKYNVKITMKTISISWAPSSGKKDKNKSAEITKQFGARTMEYRERKTEAQEESRDFQPEYDPENDWP